MSSKVHKYKNDLQKQMLSEATALIAGIFHVPADDITDISVLKKGMTNRSFLFSCQGNKYIIRIPGEGTDRLINRRQEAQVYKTITDKGLCDDAVYIDPDSGYKITRFLEGARVCDPGNVSDIKKCMKKLRALHDMHLTVGHRFDIWEQIDFYEDLRDGKPSVYEDYQRTKQDVLSLKRYIDDHISTCCLSHIDAVPDNFLFYTDDAGEEKLQLTDWEYAGMQDPHMDIAMFCIYSFYDKKQVDRLIDIYFEDGGCPAGIRIKIYCYICAGGLLWSNWCEYKKSLGVEFGEYALRQYRYAKEYYRLAKKEMEAEDEPGQ